MADILSLYKPNPSVTEAFMVNETLPDEQLSFEIFKKLVLAKKTQDMVFLSIGKMLKIMRDRKLYKKLDFDNFSQFLNSEQIDFSREKAYLYIRTYELYVEKLMLNPDEVGKMGVARLMMLVPLVKDLPKEEAVKKIEEAKLMRYNDFVREVKQVINSEGKPTVFWSEEQNKWEVRYFENITTLTSLGKYEKQNTTTR